MENTTNNDIDIYLTGNSEITFLKSIYKRHTPVFTQKKTHHSINNKIKIEPTTFVGCIENMWINNTNNINNVAFFLVKNDVDIDTITYATQPDNNNIQIIHKISIAGLQSLNKLCENDDSSFLKIPYNKYSFVPALLQRINTNFFILCVIDSKDNNITDFELRIKYTISNSEDEVRRFRHANHEYLIRRILSVSHKINIGVNHIPADIKNIPVSHLIINANKDTHTDLDLTYHIFTDGAQTNNNINQVNNPPVNYVVGDTVDNSATDPTANDPATSPVVENLVEDPVANLGGDLVIMPNTSIYIDHHLNITQNDPEYSKYYLNNYDTYFLDAHANIKSFDVQPSGSYNMKEGSYLEVNSKIETTIDLTYVAIDVLRIMGDSVALVTQATPPPLPIPAPAPIVAPAIPQQLFIPPIFNPPQMSRSGHIIREINMYKHIGLRMIQLIEKMLAKYKQLSDPDNVCLITYDTIKNGEYYYECDTCKKVFSETAYKEWHKESKSNQFKCPHCRQVVSNYPQLYINKKPSFIKQLILKFCKWLLSYFITIEKQEAPNEQPNAGTNNILLDEHGMVIGMDIDMDDLDLDLDLDVDMN